MTVADRHNNAQFEVASLRANMVAGGASMLLGMKSCKLAGKRQFQALTMRLPLISIPT
jgi:hypothetical protein